VFFSKLEEVSMQQEDKPKLTEEEFIRKAIKKLRGNYKGIHSVYNGCRKNDLVMKPFLF